MKLVVVGSDAIRDALINFGGFDVSTGSTSLRDVTQEIYARAQETTAGTPNQYVLFFVRERGMETQSTQDLINWLEQYQASQYIFLSFVGYHPSSVCKAGETFADLLRTLGVPDAKTKGFESLELQPDGSLRDLAESRVIIQPQPVSEPQPQPQPQFVPEPQPQFVSESQTQTLQQYQPVTYNNGAKVIWIVSGKGGVGKTTMALLVSIYLATIGKRTLLIDGNLGQPDVFTRLGKVATRLRDLVHPPLTITSYQPGRLGDVTVSIGSVLGENIEKEHKYLVDRDLDVLLGSISQIPEESRRDYSKAYSDALKEASSSYDYIVVDTQIVEPKDPAGSDSNPKEMVRSFLIPWLSLPQSYLLAVSDSSGAGVANTNQSVNYLIRAAGVDRSHALGVINMASRNVTDDDLGTLSVGAPVDYDTFIPGGPTNQQITDRLSNFNNSPDLITSLNRIGKWVGATPNIKVEDTPSQTKASKKRFFGRR